MKVNYGLEQLERFSGRFVAELGNYLFDMGIWKIAITGIIQTPIGELNSRTIVAICVHETNGHYKENQHILIHCSHANDFSYSNWQIEILQP
jgi:hypothetical protein